MDDITYNWNRYWVPRDSPFVYDTQGFLLPAASDAKWARWWKTDVVSFEKIRAKRCLVLLGEPGIGKSFAIEEARRNEESDSKGTGAIFLFRDLGSYNSDALLVEEIFKSSEFTAWQKHGKELHIFLDSFDECLMRVDAVANLLAQQFGQLASVENLFLRITSRTAEWQTSLEDALRKKWGPDQIGIYQLAPLTRGQVLEAAKQHVGNAEEFVKAVVTNEVVSFAIKPLTLDLLIRVWLERRGSLPPTQKDIYEQGCLQLCIDSERRQTPKTRRVLSPEERLAVASHIAAGMFLCNRAAVWTGTRLSSKPESDIGLSDLAYGSVSVQGQRLQITHAILREALDTGLFTSLGRDRLVYAHQTYGEFLAARYASHEQLGYCQICDLFTHPDDPQHKLIPQLQEAAAWVAAEDREFFEHLARTQPEVLLRSDVVTADDQTKAAVVDALLRAISNDAVQGDWWAMRGRYRKLNHPTLSRQLLKWITNTKADADVRVEAIHIADSCELGDVLPVLTKISLNKKESADLRESAANLVSRKGSRILKKRLKPLALGNTGSDPRDELRGASLKACWPEHISAKELFDSLKEPNRRFGGEYRRFLSDALIRDLKTSDLPTALAWAAVQAEQHDSLVAGYEGLVNRILNTAAEHIQSPKILRCFARTLLARLRLHDSSVPGEKSSFIQTLESRMDIRLKLAEAMVAHFKELKEDAVCITVYGLRLLNANHFDWVVERLESAKRSKTQESYAYLLSRIFYPEDAGRTNKVIELGDKYPVVKDVLSFWLKPVDLNSDEAQKARKYFFEDQERQEKRAKRQQPKLLSPLPGERLITLLDQFESGDIEAWWKLLRWAELEDTGHYCEKHYHMDMRELAGWKKASDETKGRMINAAYRYVNARDSDPQEWFWKKNIT